MASASSAAIAASASAASEEDLYFSSASSVYIASVVSVATGTLPITRIVTSTKVDLISSQSIGLEAAETSSPGLPALPTSSSSASSTPSASPGLRPSAKVGIGLGIPFALLLLAIAAFSGFRFLKHRKACQEEKEKYAAVPELYDHGGGQHVTEEKDGSAGQRGHENDAFITEQPYPTQS